MILFYKRCGIKLGDSGVHGKCMLQNSISHSGLKIENVQLMFLRRTLQIVVSTSIEMNAVFGQRFEKCSIQETSVEH